MTVRGFGSPAKYIALLMLLPQLFAGCSRAPSVDVLGSFFPSWLVCLAGAILLSAGVRFAAGKLNVKMTYPALVYLSLTAFFTFALWLIFFY